jgi:NADPH-dependent ferric siderophore reductase
MDGHLGGDPSGPACTGGDMTADPPRRLRRPAPPFRRLTIARCEARSPYLTRITLHGPELAGYAPPSPAGSVRLLLPDEPGAPLVIPVWNGNAYFHTDGRRPVIRTLTPLRHDPAAHELDIDVVLHGEGPLSEWASTCAPGAAVAVSGPGRGYAIDGQAPVLFAGDESALPAIGQLLEATPASSPVTAIVEIAHLGARVPLSERADVEVRWVERPPNALPGMAMVDAVIDAFARAEVAPATKLWVAGEAAAVQRLRRHLFEELGMSRARAHVRGYWKHGRSGDDAGDADEH